MARVGEACTKGSVRIAVGETERGGAGPCVAQREQPPLRGDCDRYEGDGRTAGIALRMACQIRCTIGWSTTNRLHGRERGLRMLCLLQSERWTTKSRRTSRR